MKKYILLTIVMVLSVAIKAQKVEQNGAVIAFSNTTYSYDTISKGSNGECVFEFTILKKLEAFQKS